MVLYYLGQCQRCRGDLVQSTYESDEVYCLQCGHIYYNFIPTVAQVAATKVTHGGRPGVRPLNTSLKPNRKTIPSIYYLEAPKKWSIGQCQSLNCPFVGDLAQGLCVAHYDLITANDRASKRRIRRLVNGQTVRRKGNKVWL